MRQQVQANVIQGYRIASGTSAHKTMFNVDGGTLGLQIPAFKKHGFDLDAYFGTRGYVCGTLNLSVAPHRVTIGAPKYFLKNIRWTDKLDKAGQAPFVENFFLDDAAILHGGKTYQGLLYIPDPATKPAGFSPTPATIEVIAQEIPGIAYGDHVMLEYNSEAITLSGL